MIATETLNNNANRLVWRRNQEGTYSSSSAYKALHLPSHLVSGCTRIWKTWAPLRVRIFLWLAVRKRHWTVDRRNRHRLDAREEC